MNLPTPKLALPKMKPWIPMVRAVAAHTGELPERLIALMWRETWCGYAPGYKPKGDPCGWGDKANGFGLFQIDKRYHLDAIHRELAKKTLLGDLYTPVGQALYACDLLHNARDWFQRSASSVKGEDLERAVYASYNAGESRVYNALMARKDPDSVTTGGDYSRFVFDLAVAVKGEAYKSLWG